VLALQHFSPSKPDNCNTMVTKKQSTNGLQILHFRSLQCNGVIDEPKFWTSSYPLSLQLQDDNASIEAKVSPDFLNENI
jgi:hypothetical protein